MATIFQNMGIFSRSWLLQKQVKAETNSSPIIIKSAIEAVPIQSYFFPDEIMKMIVLTVLGIVDHMDEWRWFKNPGYQGNMRTMETVTNQHFMITGGPKSTLRSYENLKSRMGSRIQDLEFLAISYFWNIACVFSFWSLGGDIIRVYFTDIRFMDQFSVYAGNNFKEPIKEQGIAYVNWKLTKVFSDYEKDDNQTEDKISVRFKLTNSWILPKEDSPGNKIVWRKLDYRQHLHCSLVSDFLTIND